MRLLGGALEGGADELSALLAAATPQHMSDPAAAQQRNDELQDAASTIHLDIRYAKRSDGARTALWRDRSRSGSIDPARLDQPPGMV